MTAPALAPSPAASPDGRTAIQWFCKCGAIWHGEFRAFEIEWLREQWERQHRASDDHGRVASVAGFASRIVRGRAYRNKRRPGL